MLPLLLLPLCAVVIYVACGYFVNGVEWLGRRMNFTETATGTVLAALGTALPECAVTFVAVVFGATAAQKEIGVGAALGGPLVLATISYMVVGLVLMRSASRLGRPNLRLQADQTHLSRDQGWFLAIFALKIALGLIAFAYKPWLGIAFIAAYILYLTKEMRGQTPQAEGDLDPLKLRPHQSAPSLLWILLQTGGALVTIGVASRCFVMQLEAVGHLLGIAPQLVSLLFSPLATELPETMNAVLWARQGKEKLALANISGAMMVQATIPSALGLFFTPWLFDRALVGAGLLTLCSVGYLFLRFRRNRARARDLLPVGLVYAAFGLWLLFVV